MELSFLSPPGRDQPGLDNMPWFFSHKDVKIPSTFYDVCQNPAIYRAVAPQHGKIPGRLGKLQPFRDKRL